MNKDNISEDCFLFPEQEAVNNDLINSQIYIPQLLKEKELTNSRGKIIKINKYEFFHSANTEQCSSGSPIFSENRTKVIGIHKQRNADKIEHSGYFLYPIIDIIKDETRKRINDGKI